MEDPSSNGKNSKFTMTERKFRLRAEYLDFEGLELYNDAFVYIFNYFFIWFNGKNKTSLSMWTEGSIL